MLMIGAFAFCSCSKDDPEIDEQFTINSEEAEYDESTNTCSFNGNRSTVRIKVVTGDATGKWDARCPTDDLWCSFSKDAGELVVTVDENSTDKVRESHITIVLGDNEKTINVKQEYLRNMTFASSEMLVGAPRGKYVMGITTNVSAINFDVNYVEGGEGWLHVGEFDKEEAVLKFSVDKNRSKVEKRQAYVTAVGEGEEAKFLVVQNLSEGDPIIIPLDQVDYNFADCLSYEAINPENGEKIANICREYVLQGKPGEIMTEKVVLAVYPVKDEEPDHINGFVIASYDNEAGEWVADGGSIMWNDNVTTETPGIEHLGTYVEGTIKELPTKIYRHVGGSKYTSTPVGEDEAADAIVAELKPWVVVDKREGEEIKDRGTFDEFTYRVVKIGTQYWFADNLKTTRYADGSPIPTGSDVWKSGDVKTSPACASAGYASDGTSYSNRNANSMTDDAVKVRNEVGLVYNFYAWIQQKNEKGYACEFKGEVKDAISPEGWTIPLRTDWEILHNYIVQLSENPDKDPMNALLMKCPYEVGATNKTGFNAASYRYRKYNDKTNSSTGNLFAILDTYKFDGVEGEAKSSAHTTVFFACGKDAENNFLQGNRVGCAVYVRCIKK